MASISYHPETYGLTVVAEIDYSSGSYEFDTRIVWKDKKGKLYTARDAGCSCPEPFEDYTTLESVDTFNWADLQKEVLDESTNQYTHISPLQAKEFLSAVEPFVTANQK